MKITSSKYPFVLAALFASVLLAGCVERSVSPVGKLAPTPTSTSKTSASNGSGASGTQSEAIRIDRADEDNLSQVFAYARKQQVEKVDYEITFQFEKESQTFKADTVMNVSLKLVDRPLSIDLLAKSVDHVIVNGAETKDFIVKEGSVEISPRVLKAQNRIEIQTVQVYSKTGSGLQGSVDPVDKSEYIYTDFEPYGAHLVFPCFDQPDIKGTYHITVEAPTEWRALSNTIAEKTEVKGDKTATTFAVTRPLSSYLVFVGTGAFVEIKDQFGDIPITLNVRKSLTKYLDQKEILGTTKKGLEFFANYFGTAYPFSKFGLVFAPDFTEGGMENPGNIVLSEEFIHRGFVTAAQRANLQSLILHEMAHMWFGDLVTMKWWNDLWLNESFATFMATKAEAQFSNDNSAWVRFVGEKAWGYWQDQLVTTHPIEASVSDTNEARGNFDGITYGKGGGVLKQLLYVVGEDGFKRGLKAYFQKYAYSNSERKDFITELASSSGQNLDKWTKSWLQTAGPNRVSLNWSCGSDGKINKFEIVQMPNASKQLLPHRSKIGLFRAGKVYKEQDVFFDAASTQVEAFSGSACPDFIYGNIGDHDNALYMIDPVSFKAVSAGLSGVASNGGWEDALLRGQVWRGLAQMVDDLQISTTDFFNLALPLLAKEKDEALLHSLVGARGIIARMYFNDLSPAQRKALTPKIEAAFWSRRNEIEFFDGYAHIATSSPAQLNLKMFLDDAGLPKGFKLDQDRRWEMLITLARDNYPGVRGLIASEQRRDKSSDGADRAQTALLAIPELAGKKKFFVDVLDSKKMPMAVLETVATAFNSVDHPELAQTFVQDYFSRVKNMDWGANDSLIGVYFGSLFPHVICSEELLKKSEQSLTEAVNMTAHAKRGWLEANEDVAKCVAIRNRSKQ